jgi:hypothetical protein
LRQRKDEKKSELFLAEMKLRRSPSTLKIALVTTGAARGQLALSMDFANGFLTSYGKQPRQVKSERTIYLIAACAQLIRVTGLFYIALTPHVPSRFDEAGLSGRTRFSNGKPH